MAGTSKPVLNRPREWAARPIFPALKNYTAFGSSQKDSSSQIHVLLMCYTLLAHIKARVTLVSGKDPQATATEFHFTQQVLFILSGGEENERRGKLTIKLSPIEMPHISCVSLHVYHRALNTVAVWGVGSIVLCCQIEIIFSINISKLQCPTVMFKIILALFEV